ncbi:MAG TPA: ABC transporter ATP-binding protein [Bryobacteraceae bacterium]
MDEAIRLEGIGKSYGGKTVLKDLALRVMRGQVVGVLGVNGAGKTTLSRIVAGLLKPDSGAGWVAGQELSKRSRALIGITLPDAGWDNLHTGRELVELNCRLFGFTKPEARERAKAILAAVGLAATADRRVRTYSLGTKRRLDFALAIAHDPAILVLDEPTNSMDLRGRDLIWNDILRRRAEGKAILLFSQDMAEVERCADTVAFLVDGKLGAYKTPAEIRHLSGAYRIRVRLTERDRLAQALGVVKDRCQAVSQDGVQSSITEDHLEFTSDAGIQTMMLVGVEVVNALTKADYQILSVTTAPPTLEEAVAQRI